MNHPVFILPQAMNAIQALHKSAEDSGLPKSTILLVLLRASQINGCSFCVDMHAREMKQEGQSDERVFGVSAWREMPYFDDAERAALALTEAVTRIADRPDPVPDEIWNEAASHFDERELAGLLIAIATINVWNRLNVSVRQPAGKFSSAAAQRAQKAAAG